jgi:hypothetical protein
MFICTSAGWAGLVEDWHLQSDTIEALPWTAPSVFSHCGLNGICFKSLAEPWATTGSIRNRERDSAHLQSNDVCETG